MTISKTLSKLSLAFVSVVLTLLVIEVLTRTYYPQPSRMLEQNFLFEYHRVYGWQFIANKTGRISFLDGVKTTVAINSAGMRDREYPVVKPLGKKRIVVLGDSFVSGLEVNSDEVFTEVMEQSLPKNWEVLNFAVNGYGPTQEYLMLKEKVLAYKPDIVLIVIYVRNDFDDALGLLYWNAGHQRPKANIDEHGKLIFENIPVPIAFHALKANSRLFQLVHKRLSGRKSVINIPPEARLFKKEESAEVGRAKKVMREIIKKAHHLSHENGADFVVVVAPSMVQVYPDNYWNAIKKRYHLRDEDYDLLVLNKVLERTCTDLGVPLLDLTPALRARAAAGKTLYYPLNTHWNTLGHSVVGEAITKYLNDTGLVR